MADCQSIHALDEGDDCWGYQWVDEDCRLETLPHQKSGIRWVSGIGQFGEAADLKMQTAEVEKSQAMAAKGETSRNSVNDMTVMNTVL